MEHVVSREGDLVVATGEGEASREDFTRMIEGILAELESGGGKRVLVDLREASAIRLNLEHIRGISEDTRRLSPALDGGSLAVVLKSDLEYGLARMWQSFTEYKIDFDVRVIRRMDRARRWLGLEL